MSALPADVCPDDDIAVDRLRDGATVHRPRGCPDAAKIPAPYLGAWRADAFEVLWCRRPGCFPLPSRRSPNSRFPSPSPTPLRKEAPHAA